MTRHRLPQQQVERRQRRFDRAWDRRQRRQRPIEPAVDQPALLDDQRLARQHTVEAGERRRAPGGELQLQQLVARLRHQVGGDEAGRDQRRRGRGEDEARRRLGVIKRLDPETVARQQQPLAFRVIDRQRHAAAQMAGEFDAIGAIELQRRRVERAVADQDGAARLDERLVGRLASMQ